MKSYNVENTFLSQEFNRHLFEYSSMAYELKILDKPLRFELQGPVKKRGYLMLQRIDEIMPNS